MDEEKRDAARRQIQDLAYNKWLDAGCPDDCGLQFWVEAEQEWINYYYTPDRYAVLTAGRR
jgi:hypothetical protein